MERIESEIDRFPDREFEKLTRSTIPLLCYWREDRKSKISRSCCHLDLPDRKMESEFAAELASIPHARASETDLMFTAPNLAIAIEAKWSEPRYDTVEKWRKGTSQWEAALQHWLRYLKAFADVPNRDELDDVVYQMIHRCASACAKAGSAGTAVLLYQIFDDGEHDTGFYARDMERLISVIKPKTNLHVALQTVQIRRTLEYTTVEESLPADARTMARIIREAVKHKVLFDFDEPKLKRLC